jgi:hypothetical protein
MKRWTIVLLTLALVTSAMPVGAAPTTGKQLLRNLLRRDLLRDLSLPTRRLKAPRTVHRYTTWGRAIQELRKGLRPWIHTTDRAQPGPPLSPEAAKRRYVLRRNPKVRETIRIPAGTRIRQGKVIGSDRDVGEIVLVDPLPPESIRKVTVIRKP